MLGDIGERFGGRCSVGGRSKGGAAGPVAVVIFEQLVVVFRRSARWQSTIIVVSVFLEGYASMDRLLRLSCALAIDKQATVLPESGVPSVGLALPQG